MIAFQKFKDIEKLSDSVEKHRAWLKDYEGKKYSKGIDGTDLIKWKNTKYSNDNFETDINKVGELGNRLRIEFDGDETKAKEDLEKVYQKLKEKKWGFIRSSHKGKSDYLWVEFTKDLTQKEKEKFLRWIAPIKSEVDINFSRSSFCFPVLFAIHWKHSNYRELPIEYFEGEQIDYDKLDIKKESGELRKVKTTEGIYYTFKKASNIFTKEGQAEQFNKIQPLFYDRAGLWWLWNEEIKCWEIVDEIDILNMIREKTGEDTISSKNRNEILESLKQEGRKNIPLTIKPTWIQFRENIFDISTGEKFEATPKYFVTNPIPYKTHKDNYEQTPNLDKIFEEWVGKDYVQTLYEIIAYCLLPDYPIHRLFCFIGAGLNGKSKFLELLRKFIGKNNCCSTELDTLINSRFEITRLHKKLVCQMGETNFNEISKTSIIKKLTGDDLIGFEYKNKNPFEEKNYAKIIIATNNLPTTTDKTIGFYRRWLIIDFPNQFSEKKDILQDIPEEEYESLALKCVGILNDLLKKREFYKEGSVEQRMKRYEAKSDFLQKFLDDFTEQDPNSDITKADFYKKFAEWCRENRYRQMAENNLGKKMKDKEIEAGRRYVDWLFDGKGGQLYVWLGIKWKN